MDFISDILPYLERKTASSIMALDCVSDITEIRMTLGKPIYITTPSKTFALTDSYGQKLVASKMVFSHSLNAMSGGSLYSIAESLRQGFVTIKGGHRVGICGSAVLTDGKVHSVRDICSLCFRVSKEIIGCAGDIYKEICIGDYVHSCLIASPPGYGKTTILRDLCRLISTGIDVFSPKRVGIADERCEIAAMHEGVSKYDLGDLSFVCSSYPKHQAMNLMLRTMCPDVIITDEIGTQAEFKSVREAIKCGVCVISSVHALDIEDLKSRFGNELKSFEEIFFINNKKKGHRIYRRCLNDY